MVVSVTKQMNLLIFHIMDAKRKWPQSSQSHDNLRVSEHRRSPAVSSVSGVLESLVMGSLKVTFHMFDKRLHEQKNEFCFFLSTAFVLFIIPAVFVKTWR